MNDAREQAQIIELPYKMVPAKELRGCQDDDIYSFQLRLCGVELIRLYQAGMLSAKDIAKNLQDINKSLTDFGRPTLSLDFLEDKIP